MQCAIIIPHLVTEMVKYKYNNSIELDLGKNYYWD